MTNRITGKLIPKDNRNVQFYADFFPDGDIGGGGSGSTDGIPTIDKNTQPNIVWREPTAEDLAKFHSAHIVQVADLPEGKLPLLWVIKYIYDEVEYTEMVSVVSAEFSEGNDGLVSISGSGTYALTEDWSMIGKVGIS